MKDSCVHLKDLPDELLMIIFRKLRNVGILYSFHGIDKRFNNIVHDPIFTKYLTLLNRLDESCHPLPAPILNRFCLHILPDISDQIKSLHLESSSLERILLSTNYPNLSGLGLYDLEIEQVKYIVTDETSSIHKLKKQISAFVIDITKNEKQESTVEMIRLVFTYILTMFINLRYLNFGPSPNCYQELSFGISAPTVFSSNLFELHVNVDRFTDCLYILDGRFNQLRTLYIKISIIFASDLTIDNKEKLPRLRCFSLTCDVVLNDYDELILPLLHRMFNLQKLGLYLEIRERQTFVDGNDLTRNIINDMPQLTKFSFNIHSSVRLHNLIDLPSDEDIQHTFTDFKYTQVTTCVNYFSELKYGQCHVYSYPFTMQCYEHLANNFPSGRFKCVREVSLYDEEPFEHEFFLRIAQAFPLMEKLTLNNCKPQKDTRRRKSKDNNQDSSIIKYSHLTDLNLNEAHDDYVEQFLIDTKTYLPKNTYLLSDYQSIRKVTHNFTREATRMNCSKVNYVYGMEIDSVSNHFKDYFLSTQEI